MQITREEIGKHYAAMSDGELEDIDPAELTEVARTVYELEMKKRHLVQAAPAQEVDEDLDTDPESVIEELEAEDEPDWLDTAACVCSFRDVHRARLAYDSLIAVGVPCHLVVGSADPEDRASLPVNEYQVMVPAVLNLKAISVLDQEIFNEEREASWRAHLAELSNEELRALTPEVIGAGLRDGLERLTRAYNDEIARRKKDA